MLRVVLDANVIVSGIATLPYGQSAPPTILRRWYQGEFEIVLSSAILEEIRYALGKPYFQTATRVVNGTELLRDLELAEELVILNDSVVGIATHRHDDRIIETAVRGNADYLVTGDKELLGVTHPYRFKIVHPNDFLSVLDDDPQMG